ncbi:transcription elongation factor S-II [Angomonas deanei]|nr:transcription elongation factor S-II [Angomonas deanei]|eukprot:EPY24655.1 transcription elongation factor S-II [Angomonas deanei]
MQSYAPGDRVWIHVKGYDWWPARILSEEEAPPKQQPDSDISALFYPGTETETSHTELNSTRDAQDICFFETSSVKAVTNNPDLRQAIVNAESDESANPLKADSSAAVTRVKPEGRKVEKRPRPEAAAARREPVETSHHLRHLSQAELTEVVEAINTAVDKLDLDSLRLSLYKLRDVDVQLEDLEKTKIGKAVGKVLGVAEFSPVWAVCRAIISFWARHLPEETRHTIKQIKTNGQKPVGGSADLAATKELRSPTSALSPTRAPVKKFLDLVRMYLDDPNSATTVDEAALNDILADIKNTITHPDDRSILLQRMPKFAFIRENFLSGKWTARTYLEQPNDIFVTQEEKDLEARKYAERIAAEEAAEQAGINLTHQFPCPTCGGETVICLRPKCVAPMSRRQRC